MTLILDGVYEIYLIAIVSFLLNIILMLGYLHFKNIALGRWPE
jgi:hypothetical protein